MSTGEVPFDAFGMDDIDPDDVSSSGGVCLPKGDYRLVVIEVVLHNSKTNSLQIETEVRAAKDDSLVGRKHVEFQCWPAASHKDGGKFAGKVFLAWCFAAKTLSRESFLASQAAGQTFDPIWLEAMVGADVLGTVKNETYNDKMSAKLDNRVWAIDDSDRKGMPGWVGPAAGTEAPPATTAPQQQQTVPPEKSAFDGLV